MWKRLVPILTRDKLLTEVDSEAFVAACQSWGIFVECEKFLKINGRVMEISKVDKNGDVFSTYYQQRPEVSISNGALKHFKSFCIEFGLTPAARAGIPVNDSEDADFMKGLLAR